MSGEKTLTIKISGDIADYKSKLEDAQGKTEDLSDVLKTVATTSAIAFAGLTAAIGFSVKAYGESEQAAKRLTQALINQGIYTDELKEKYEKYAASVQAKTGVDDDAVIASQAVLQQYLGQTEVTEELTMAVADLAETMGGDLNAAAEKIGRSVGTARNALKAEGLVMDETATASEKLAKVTEFVNARFGGLAEKAGEGVGSMRKLESSFGNFQEGIGKQFAPIVEAVANRMAAFFDVLSQNQELVGFTAALLAGGAAMAALGIAVPLAVNGFLALQAALAAMNVTLTATKVAVIGLAGATGIGLLIVALGTVGAYFLTAAESAKQFKNDLPGAREEIKKLAAEVVQAEALIAQRSAIAGAQDGYVIDAKNRVEANKKRIEELQKVVDGEEKIQAEANAKNLEISKKIQAEQNKEAEVKRQQQANNIAVLEAERRGASQAELEELKKQGDLKIAQMQADNEREKLLLQQKFQDQQVKVDEARALSEQKRLEFDEAAKAVAAEGDGGELAAAQTLSNDKIALLVAETETEQEITNRLYADKIKSQQKFHSDFITAQKQFGTTYALINAAMNSTIYQGTKSAFGELASLQQSSNATLKSIGKVAAVANIVIKTAESAMNIYAGFSTIPIIGPALGVAGAAAAVAFGAEQTGKVLGAAEGGIVTGGTPGKDSVPAMLMPGELVVPEQNFDEVVGSVQAGRSGGGANGSGNAEMLALLSSIDARLANAPAAAGGNSVTIQGDLMADDFYLDRLIERISERLQFGNAKLVGVNS